MEKGNGGMGWKWSNGVMDRSDLKGFPKPLRSLKNRILKNWSTGVMEELN